MWADYFSPFLYKASICNRVSAGDSQSVHLRAVEGVTRHLLDAISGEPSVIRERSQITVMWLRHRTFSSSEFI